MQKRLIPATLLLAYAAFLIKILVFKELPLIRFGHLMLKMGGQHTGPANFIPLKTILPYLLGQQGSIIAAFNLVGNVVLLVPFGFLVPFAYRAATWKKAFVIAVAFPLALELMQAAFRVGTFDVDDILLNGIGIMMGYWVAARFLARQR